MKVTLPTPAFPLPSSTSVAQTLQPSVAIPPPFRRHPPNPERSLSTDYPTLLPLSPEEPIDLDHTFGCGQIFRWRRHGDTWYGPFRRGSLAVRRVPLGVEVRALGKPGEVVTAEDAWRFLGLDTALAGVYDRLRSDPWLEQAIQPFVGLRILRQDPWECVANYICSQWNNIPKIELSTGRIAQGQGTLHPWPDGIDVSSFPGPETLAPLADLPGCALGYRCRYLLDTARLVARGEVDLAGLRGRPYEHALAELLRLPGIGRKVADCILLFSLDQPRACPVDVWVRRIIHELYPRELAEYLPDAASRIEKGLSTREYDAILRFAGDRWGEDAGYAQQYLFHARRMLGRLKDEG